MVKKKTTKKSAGITQQQLTIVLGYLLFASMVVYVLFSLVIPWVAIIFNPRALHLNATVFLLSLTIGVLLPALVGYFAGDAATRAKSKGLHHYNGVLFGILAYWLSLFFGVLGSETVTSIRQAIPSVVQAEIANSWPVLATAIVTVLVAIGYTRHQSKRPTVLDYAPYKVLLIGSAAIVSIVLPLVSQVIASDFLWLAVLGPTLIVGFVFMTYMFIGKRQPSRSRRLEVAIIAATMGLIAMNIASQLFASFISSTPYYIAFSIISVVLGFAVWLIYLTTAIHHPDTKRK